MPPSWAGVRYTVLPLQQTQAHRHSQTHTITHTESLAINPSAPQNDFATPAPFSRPDGHPGAWRRGAPPLALPLYAHRACAWRAGAAAAARGPPWPRRPASVRAGFVCHGGQGSGGVRFARPSPRGLFVITWHSAVWEGGAGRWPRGRRPRTGREDLGAPPLFRCSALPPCPRPRPPTSSPSHACLCVCADISRGEGVGGAGGSRRDECGRESQARPPRAAPASSRPCVALPPPASHVLSHHVACACGRVRVCI